MDNTDEERTLYHAGKTLVQVENKHEKDEVIYNLWEDIFCIKESLNKTITEQAAELEKLLQKNTDLERKLWLIKQQSNSKPAVKDTLMGIEQAGDS